MIINELLAYVGFDDEDVRRLRELHPKLEPHFPAIAAKFYDAVWKSPGAAAVLSGPDQVERLRCTLIEWMSSGLRGPWDAKFNEKRARIGRRHVTIGLAQQYMFTAMNIVRTAYVDRIGELYESAEALAVVRSVNKLFDIELALMMRHYQLVSEERLVTRERQMQSDRLQAMQTMSAGLAHEVRNPLNAAKLQLELLERRLKRSRSADDAAKVLEPVELAHHEIERLTQMLNEFLSFARPPELRVVEQDVVAIAHHVIELEHPLAERTGIVLELAPGPESALAAVDPGKVHQVIQNLVRNALEAAPPKGHVTVGVALEEGKLHIRVGDNGPGIPEHIRQRIFEPFFSTKETGTGMGMAIVHNFVGMHGGTIDITTGAHGTLVDIAIPRLRG